MKTNRTRIARDPAWAPKALAAALILVSVPHLGARAQDYNGAVEFEDLGFTAPIDAGARPAGMAGAYVAAGDDAHMLVYNPAGLARIRRVELSLGLHQQRNGVEETFYGVARSIDTRDGGFDGASLAWPIPTYRGGLVAAFGVYRAASMTFDLGYDGVNDKTQTIDHFLVQQAGSVYSYNLGVGVDLSPLLSGGVTVFLLDGTLDRLRQFDFTYLDFTPRTSVFVKEDVTGDVTGVGGRVGVQFFVKGLIVGGISFTPPVWVALGANGTAEITEHRDNAPDSFERVPVSIDTKYLLPYRLDMGVAVTLRRLVVEFDFGYADWTNAAIDRKRLRTPGSLAPTFREVFEYRVGFEYTFEFAPLRVRGGYAFLPYPLAYLQNDRIDENDLSPAEPQRERQRVALGVGGLVADALTLDASLSYTAGRRSSAHMDDERTAYRLIVGAAYRF